LNSAQNPPNDLLVSSANLAAELVAEVAARSRSPIDRGQSMTPEPASVAAPTLRVARKVGVAVLGFSVLTFGVALIVLPAPGSLVILLGLAILATEFLWARKLLDPVRKLVPSLVFSDVVLFCRRARLTSAKKSRPEARR
jgi:uncharacterized protein (TIGR02611 family)